MQLPASQARARRRAVEVSVSTEQRRSSIFSRAIRRAPQARILNCSRVTAGGTIMNIFTILFVVLLVAWLLGLSIFHVAGGLIHILLIVAKFH
jgi:hypothetical protein